MNTRKFYGSKPMTSFALALPQSDSDDDLCNSSDDETIIANGESLLLDTDTEKTTDDGTDNDKSENGKYLST